MTIACLKADGNVSEASEEFMMLMSAGITVGAMTWSRFERTVLSGQVEEQLPMSSLETSKLRRKKKRAFAQESRGGRRSRTAE